ncbi:GAF domain-containing protein [Shouchella shacheensis]|uniref:GAF domain-containing protein n=1 Tax=Shouchella shacheensis TaxID=1649580 RepID=UPI00073FB36F|nr:GAF domain-containing protein [Shouchella shacheensis]
MRFDRKRNDAIVEACARLKAEVSCDFVGLALQKQTRPEITWRYALGNTNTKYVHIKLRYGKGIAGKVMASNAAMEVNDFPRHINGRATDYPIMLAEKLVAAFAVPVAIGGITRGVLLIGCRKAHDFTEAEKGKVKEAAREAEALLASRLAALGGEVDE